MSAMLEAQLRFFQLLALLYAEAVRLKLPIKLGCGLCQHPHHSRFSLHHDSLAQDLPMIHPDGRYGTWEDYKPLGDYWKSLDPNCTWGGDYDLNADGVAKDDANHFSYRFGGRR